MQVGILIEKQLRRAADTLLDATQRTAYDAEIYREAEDLKDETKRQRVKQRLDEARAVIATHLGSRKELPEKSRPALARQLEAIGYSKPAVQRILDRIPLPPDEQKVSPATVLDSPAAAAANGDIPGPVQAMSPEQVRKRFQQRIARQFPGGPQNAAEFARVQELALEAGIPLPVAAEVIHELREPAPVPMPPSADGSDEAAGLDVTTEGSESAEETIPDEPILEASPSPAGAAERGASPAGPRIIAWVMPVAALAVLAVVLMLISNARGRKRAPATAGPRRSGAATDAPQPPAPAAPAPGDAEETQPPPATPASRLLACATDTERLKLMNSLSAEQFQQTVGLLASSVRLGGRSPGPRVLSAREIMYMAYGLRPSSHLNRYFHHAAMRPPRPAEQAALSRAVSQLLQPAAVAAPPSLSPADVEIAEQLGDLINDACAREPANLTQAFVCLAGALHATDQLAKLAEGKSNALSATHIAMSKWGIQGALMNRISDDVVRTYQRPGPPRPSVSPPAAPRATSQPAALPSIAPEKLKALHAALLAGGLRQRREAIEELAADGSDKAVAIFESALRRHTKTLSQLELVRGLSRCRSPSALTLMLERVKGRNSVVAHEAAVQLTRMVGRSCTRATRNATTFILPRTNTVQDRAHAARELAKLVSAVPESWLNPLRDSSAPLFTYQLPVAVPAGSPLGTRVAGLPAAAGAVNALPPPRDLGALAALIVNDLSELGQLWRTTTPAHARSDRATPWRLLAAKRPLPAAPAQPDPGSGGSVEGILGKLARNMRRRVPRLPAGTEGQDMLDAMEDAANALADKIRALPRCSRGTAVSVERALMKGTVGEKMSAAPLRAMVYRLDSLNELLATYASVLRPEAAERLSNLSKTLRRENAAAKTLRGQFAAHSRFLINAQLIVCGVTRPGGAHP